MSNAVDVRWNVGDVVCTLGNVRHKQYVESIHVYKEHTTYTIWDGSTETATYYEWQLQSYQPITE